jgi:hypothetical protein
MSAAKEKANEKEKELPPEDRVLLDKYLRERQAEFRTVVTTVVGLFALVGALVVWSVQKSGELAGQAAAQAGADRQIARVDQQISDKGKEISQIVNLAQQSALDSANRATQLVEQRLKEKGDELTRIVTTAQAFAQESSIKAAQLVVEVERLREAAQAETKNAEALRQTAIALDEQIGKSKELLSGRVDDIAASLATRPEFKAIAEAAIGLLPPDDLRAGYRRYANSGRLGSLRWSNRQRCSVSFQRQARPESRRPIPARGRARPSGWNRAWE